MLLILPESLQLILCLPADMPFRRSLQDGAEMALINPRLSSTCVLFVTIIFMSFFFNLWR